MGSKRNWSIYNQHLVDRGRIDFFIDAKLLSTWRKELRKQNKGKVGRPFDYPNSLMVALHQLKSLFHLAYRELKGLANSLADSVLHVRMPHFTVVQKRLAKLNLRLETPVLTPGSVVAIDSTGLKATRGWEWISKYKKRKKWIKFHAVADTRTHRFIAFKATSGRRHDTTQFKPLMKKLSLSKISKVFGDSAYDSNDNFEFLEKRGMEAGIRLRKVGRGRAKGKMARFRAMQEQFGISVHKDRRQKFRGHFEDAQDEWKKRIGYGDRWQEEASFGSFKGMFGEHVYSKNWEAMENELILKVNLYNQLI
ncbi:MAG: IS5 family transposase [Candidatus Methanoperedens sp.]|nr:IS5 family transposase [Candidatus Methanoperedens sp.]